jgi:hypothetical protein
MIEDGRMYNNQGSKETPLEQEALLLLLYRAFQSSDLRSTLNDCEQTCAAKI